NCISARVGQQLAQQLGGFANLKVLDLGYNALGDHVLHVLASVSEHCRFLSDLDISSNGITDQGALGILGFLQKAALLEYFDCSLNQFTAAGCNLIIEGATGHPSLAFLALRGSMINDSSCLPLARLVTHTSRLEQLILSGSKFQNPAIFNLFASAATGSPSLLILGLAHCSFSQETLPFLADLIRNTKSIELLNLTDLTVPSPRSLDQIFDALCHNTSLLRFHTSPRDKLGPQLFSRLLASLEKNTSLLPFQDPKTLRHSYATEEPEALAFLTRNLEIEQQRTAAARRAVLVSRRLLLFQDLPAEIRCNILELVLEGTLGVDTKLVIDSCIDRDRRKALLPRKTVPEFTARNLVRVCYANSSL
ncbi:hypothetical protein HDU91_002377, partial [Kappamyces sp. JEL0680]